MDIDLISADTSCFELVDFMCDRFNVFTVIAPLVRLGTEKFVIAIEIFEW